ncbi:hypothetical protein WQ57_11900 [Mesobacillus campisalis]|uniref:Uncharacterized protein n=1 Tax=Mesobacillus campisalis TaxID=1408103 RepID=A0A0M2SUQ4_9BACI|nr:hypothetical protein [Mesobacillus campisalis]KKK37873.1 hypothetical protein WQ57_11900 [Mesobacillus campisalis]
METVTIVTFKVKGLPEPIKIASQYEPSINQIGKMISDIVKANNMSGDIQFKKFLQENGQKMFIYEIGGTKCVVLVEKLEKVIEFEN